MIETDAKSASGLAVGGFALDAHFQLAINTTNATATTTGFVAQQSNGQFTGNVVERQPISVAPGVEIQIGGILTIVSTINLSGMFDAATRHASST